MAERKGVIVDLFNGQCGLCCYCQNKMTLKLGRKKTATVEHILPRSHGGKDEFNLAAACDDCNSERGNMPLLLYLAGRKYGMKYYKPKKKKAEVPSGLPKLPRKLQRRLGQNSFKMFFG